MLIPVKRNERERTHIEIRVKYSSFYRELYLDVTPVTANGEYVSHLISDGIRKTLARMPRYSKGRELSEKAKAKEQIESKSGLAWEIVQKVLFKYNLELD